MIDLGRKADMQVLMLVVNNPFAPMMQRRRAYRVMQSIRRKMSDPTILRLRLRLIAASVANDIPEVEKISDRINDYERNHHLARKY